MKNKRQVIFGIALVFLTLVVGYYVGKTVSTTKDFDWKELSIDKTGKGYGFTSEALFNSDISLPEIKSLSGKTKFIKSQNATSDEFNLGYVVSVDIDKINFEKIPQKYKVEKKEQYKAGEVTVLPIEEAVFEISFAFVLKDKDGFEIVKLKSPPHSLYTGKVNDFQDIVEQSISSAIADRTVSIVLNMTIEKCETCR